MLGAKPSAFKANARDIASRNRKPSNTLNSSRHHSPHAFESNEAHEGCRLELGPARVPRNDDHFDFPSRFRGLGR
jgi:hypothetical protein